MSASEWRRWADVDRVTASWEHPEEGAAAVELWSDSGGLYPYILLPLLGDWRAMVDSRAEAWVEACSALGIRPVTFAVSEYSEGAWHRRVIWSAEGGIRWLS